MEDASGEGREAFCLEAFTEKDPDELPAVISELVVCLKKSVGIVRSPISRQPASSDLERRVVDAVTGLEVPL
jgi:hypothetical protein